MVTKCWPFKKHWSSLLLCSTAFVVVLIYYLHILFQTKRWALLSKKKKSSVVFCMKMNVSSTFSQLHCILSFTLSQRVLLLGMAFHLKKRKEKKTHYDINITRWLICVLIALEKLYKSVFCSMQQNYVSNNSTLPHTHHTISCIREKELFIHVY